MREEDEKRAARLLASMIEMAGLSRQDLDERMGQGRGYTSQILTQRVHLKFGHVLQILEALDVEPAVFFRILYPEAAERRDSVPLLERFLGRLHGAGYDEAAPVAPPPEPAFDWAELDRRVQSAITAAIAAAPKAQPDPRAKRGPKPTPKPKSGKDE